MLKLIPAPKHYSWGSDDQDNLLKKIFLSCLSKMSNAKKKEELLTEAAHQPIWAEIWIGTHPSGMTITGDTGDSLLATIEKDLPFLFKVLAIKQCLSIQTHPDAKSAIQLHAKDPKNYPDANPKPEMAIAIDYLDAFCGFCSPDELRSNLRLYSTVRELVAKSRPETLAAIDSPNSNCIDKHVQNLIVLFNTLPIDILEMTLGKIDDEINAKSNKDFRDLTMLKMRKEFGNDSGILVSLLLKIVHLKPLEAISIPALVPHAYISGTIIECMAPSDNVIRLGLTPKFKDAENFLSLFEYNHFIETRIKPDTYSLHQSHVQLIHFPTPFSNYFDVFIVRSKTDEQANLKTVELEFTQNTVFLNMGKVVSVQGNLMDKFDCVMTGTGRLDLHCKHDELLLVICSKSPVIKSC
jgi:mannose-6-phosphate isomerase